LQRLLLLSRIEKKARQETFDAESTVIFGENDTGKSHLMKSIYGAFGADSSVINEKWANASVTIMLRFSVGEESYAILRMDDRIALFDGNDALLWSYRSCQRVGPKIAELLDFNIMLPTKYNDLIVPPPQFCFLPFYQDRTGAGMTLGAPSRGFR
jgi:energy-coupling factor transporter ATP-binding protein EcfA2